MRGLELRKRTSDLVVNDLAPDMVYQLEKEGLRLDKVTGRRLPVRRVQSSRSRSCRTFGCATRSATPSIGRPLSTTCAAASRPSATSMLPPDQLGVSSPTCSCSTTTRHARRRCSTRPAIPTPTATARGRGSSLSFKTSNVEFYRLQAAVIQQNLEDVGIDLDVRSYEFATLYADILKGNFQMYSLQWVGGALADPDILRRVFHSQQVPPAGFNRGHFSDPEVDRLIDEASQATDLRRRDAGCTARFSSGSQRLRPYISLWHRTNFALSQPERSGHSSGAARRFHVPAEMSRASRVELPRMKKRSRFLQVPIEPFTSIRNSRPTRFSRRWSASRFRGARSESRIRVWQKMLADDVTIFMGMAGALSAGGLRMVVAYLIEHRYIDCLVSTGANLYHDLHETRGRHHYLGLGPRERRRAGRRSHRSRLRHLRERRGVLRQRRLDWRFRRDARAAAVHVARISQPVSAAISGTRPGRTAF